ncbi:MAG: hypothetical protein ACLTDV_08395 [Eubacterium sp.]
MLTLHWPESTFRSIAAGYALGEQAKRRKCSLFRRLKSRQRQRYAEDSIPAKSALIANYRTSEEKPEARGYMKRKKLK